MAMERLKNTENDLYFVFTVQEEVGLRGARTAAYGVAPDYGIAVDVTDSDDIPSAPHACSSVAGKGAAIKVMDSSVICHPSVVAKLEKLALTGNIPCQKDILRFGAPTPGPSTRAGPGCIPAASPFPPAMSTRRWRWRIWETWSLRQPGGAFAQAQLT